MQEVSGSIPLGSTKSPSDRQTVTTPLAFGGHLCECRPAVNWV